MPHMNADRPGAESARSADDLNPVKSATVERLMCDIESEVRRQRRTRLIDRGGPHEYRDEAVFTIVEQVLRRAIDHRDLNALLIPEMLDADEPWELQLPLRLESHRRVLGRPILFVKRRLLRPLMHWLYDYTRENFRRQQRVNTLLFASIEELAIENAKLKLDLAELQSGRMAP
jgi:hypothetical protein